MTPEMKANVEEHDLRIAVESAIRDAGGVAHPMHRAAIVAIQLVREFQSSRIAELERELARLQKVETLWRQIDDALGNHPSGPIAALSEQVSALQSSLSTITTERDSLAQQSYDNATRIFILTEERDEARAEIERYKTPCATPEGFENILDASGAFKEIRKLKAEIKWTYDSNEAVLKSLAEARAERDALKTELQNTYKNNEKQQAIDDAQREHLWQQRDDARAKRDAAIEAEREALISAIRQIDCPSAGPWGRGFCYAINEAIDAIRARSLAAKSEEGK